MARYEVIILLKVDDNKILELYNQGLLHREIAARIGCKTCTVTNHLNRMGIHTYGRNQREKILELHNQGLYDHEIAKQLNISRSDVTILLNRQGVKNRKSKIKDIDMRNRISQSLVGRFVGEKNPNYKGYSDLKEIARGIFKTISKRLIRERNFTCEICGKRGGDLETHHIKPFSLIFQEFIKNSFNGDKSDFYNQITNYQDFIDETNMVVVCHDCHHKIHYSDNHELSPYRWESATTIEKAV